jgi:mannose-6-phosphate isomerase-like protein (cupin superfamily)
MLPPRRTFLKTVASLAPAAAFPELFAQGSPAPSAEPGLHPVRRGQDRTGSPHSLGFSTLCFKTLSSDTGGNLFIIEHTNLAPNKGPALHLHYGQDEWFYVMEGTVMIQVADQRVTLHAGDSVLGPRRIPHTFSAIDAPAHMLIAFTPAGRMEQYFIDAAAQPQLAATEAFMNRYDMKWLGPSPFWKS